MKRIVIHGVSDEDAREIARSTKNTIEFSLYTNPDDPTIYWFDDITVEDVEEE